MSVSLHFSTFFLYKDESMRKLVFGLIFLASVAQAENICVAPTTGYMTAPDCTSAGAMEVDVQDITPGTGATDLGKAEDGTPANGETGVEVFGIHRASPTASATTAGKFGPAHINLANGAWYADLIASTSRVCVTITPDTNIFAASDIVGPAAGASGLLTFANVFRAVTLAGLLSNATVVNSEVDGIAFDMCLFNADPSASTVAANGPFTLNAADKQKLLGCFSVSDGRAFAAYEEYQAQPNVKLKSASTSLYAILRTTGAPTWAAAQTVDVCLTVDQD